MATFDSFTQNTSERNFRSVQLDRILLHGIRDVAAQSSEVLVPKNSSVNNQYLLTEKIGGGASGAVYRALKKLDKREYAVKIITLSNKDEHKQAKLDSSNNEKHILNLLRDLYEQGKFSNHVIQYLEGEDYVTPEQTVEVWIVFDCFHFDLPLLIEKRLKDRIYFSSTKVLELAKQILAGLVFLHNNNIAHLDVKPENVLGRFTSKDSYHLVISDFGTSTDKADKLTTVQKGTPKFQAPEILSKTPYDPILTDAYSFGLTIYCIITGNCEEFKLPLDYSKSLLAELPADFDSSIYSEEEKKKHEADKEARSVNKKTLISIINGCVVADPKVRTRLSSVLTADKN